MRTIYELHDHHHSHINHIFGICISYKTLPPKNLIIRKIPMRKCSTRIIL